MGEDLQFSPGQLVRARGREWVVLESGHALKLRPLAGSEVNVESIVPSIELEGVTHATFAPPTLARGIGGRDAALLLSDALRLSLRRGAGPFRSFGHLNFEPRSYQLAPLMMALRQETIRLLIADDVGVGKTIEAGLILRELIDQGDADRFVVLCPPHLVDQWVSELKGKFSLAVTPVTATSASKLERQLPPNTSIFEEYPFTVVSMDFIKSERRFHDFKRACPNLVVIDEAHAAVNAGRTRQRRYDLVRALADDKMRGIILMTATPHSGDEDAFHRLLGLLDKDFESLKDAGESERRSLRPRLARHFIQRRRGDISRETEPNLFPQAKYAEVSYRFTVEYEKFFINVLNYCAEAVESVKGESKRRLAFWGMLALMRCVGSSPAAALQALRNRRQRAVEACAVSDFAAEVLDGGEYQEHDLEPDVTLDDLDDPNVAGLIDAAKRLVADPTRDPKISKLKTVLRDLLNEGHSPIVFCRYIATAEYISLILQRVFKTHKVDVVTGGMPSDARERRVRELGSHAARVLVATDCLSEGINLQEWFDAVVHYDLSWNPTRHQQRDGRIDRFGQKNLTVRTVLLYGENNPVDGAVLQVILRKSKAIAKETGVAVPLPDNEGSLTRALMSAVLLREHGQEQRGLQFGFDALEETKAIDIAWRDASEDETRSRTIFAQNTLKLGDVTRAWREGQQALGNFEDTERFVCHAMERLGLGLEELGNGSYLASLNCLPEKIKERFASDVVGEKLCVKPVKIGFTSRPPRGAVSTHRTHIIPSVLAELIFEQTLDQSSFTDDLAALPRVGAWTTTQVKEVLWVMLLRVRHRLESSSRYRRNTAIAEEAAVLAFSAATHQQVQCKAEAFELLKGYSGNLSPEIQRSHTEAALAAIDELTPSINSFATQRAAILEESHMRVRQVLKSTARLRVTARDPVDIIGLYVLMPSL